MTQHETCHSSVDWTVSKATDDLVVSDSDLTSSDFESTLSSLDLPFPPPGHTDHCAPEDGWKTYATLTSHPSVGSKTDLNNNNHNGIDVISDRSHQTLSSHHQAYKSSITDDIKMREIGHIVPLSCGMQQQQLVAPSPSDVMASTNDVGQPHLVTSHTEWMNLVASMNLTQLYDGTTTIPFQYILGAPTTPATKLNEESLTYLNQGQSYEIKLKRLGDTIGATDTEQYLKSIVRVVFHERRLQYMEREQLETWRRTRPGERIIDIDIPLSYGLLDVKIDPQQSSSLEFIWDARREAGIFVKVNAISTEFTARRHGGEKGVPFRIQVETYSLHGGDEPPHILHCASCQVKVFKPKGADRKHKTDREKLDKRSDAEREKYQPSFECTVLTEIPLDQVKGYLEQLYVYKPGMHDSQLVKDLPPTSPTTTPLTLGMLNQLNTPSQLSALVPSTSNPNLLDVQTVNGFNMAPAVPAVGTSQSNASADCSLANCSDLSKEPAAVIRSTHVSASQQRAPCVSVTVTQGMSFINMMGSRESLLSSRPVNKTGNGLNSSMTPRIPDCQINHEMTNINNSRSHESQIISRAERQGMTTFTATKCLTPESNSEHVVQWLNEHRFSQYVHIFENFSGADLLRLNREELIQICGLADGIRLDNALQAKNIRPKLTIYVCQENELDHTRRNSSADGGNLLRHSTSSQWDMLSVSPSGSRSPSLSPCPSSSHLSTYNSDPSLPTSNNPFSPRISSSSYFDRRRGSIQLPTQRGSSSTFVPSPSPKRRFAHTEHGAADDDGVFEKRARTRHADVLSRADSLCYCAIFLESCTASHLAEKLAALFNIECSLIGDLYYQGSSGFNVLVSDSVVQNLVDQARYTVEAVQQDNRQYRIMLKIVDH